MIYCVNLVTWPKRGEVAKRIRYIYVSNRVRAWRLAKQIIAKTDRRYKEFGVTIKVHKTGKILNQWVKVNGKIVRTR